MSNLLKSESLRVFGLELTDDDLQELRAQLDRIDEIEREAYRETVTNPRVIGRESIRRTQQPTDQEGEI